MSSHWIDGLRAPRGLVKRRQRLLSAQLRAGSEATPSSRYRGCQTTSTWSSYYQSSDQNCAKYGHAQFRHDLARSSTTTGQNRRSPSGRSAGNGFDELRNDSPDETNVSPSPAQHPVKTVYITMTMISRHGEPRTVILHKGPRGFGFVLRGAKTMSGMKDLQPLQNRVPALQYLDSVEAGSVADRAGLRPGDFILAVRAFEPLVAHHSTRPSFFRVMFRSTGKTWRKPRTKLWWIAFAVPAIWSR